MTPDDILATGQVIPAKRLLSMMARYGFTYRYAQGSHIICTHSAYPDEIVGLVQGTSDIVYQRNAAEACKRVVSRKLAPSNVTTPIDSTNQLPSDYVYFRGGNQLYIRSKKHPIIGIEFNDTDNLGKTLNDLSARVADMHKWYEVLKNKYEFNIEPQPDGSVHLKHQVYALEEIIYPYGSSPQSLYPQNTFEYLKNYTTLYDHYMSLGDYEEYLKVNEHNYRYSVTTTPQGLKHYSMYPSPKAKKILQPYEIISTKQGRLDDVSITHHVISVVEKSIAVFEQWGRTGMEYTDIGNDKIHCTHEFMEIDLVVDSPYVLKRNISDTLELALSNQFDQQETLGLAEEMFIMCRRLMELNKSFDNLQHMLTAHYMRWNDAFSKQVKRLMDHGYARQHGQTPDKSFGLVSFIHPNEQYRSQTFRILNQGTSNRKTFIVLPYKKMIDEMSKMADEADAKKQNKQSPKTHALMQQNAKKPAPLFQGIANATAGISSVSGVNLGHSVLSTNILRGHAARIRNQIPDKKTIAMVKASHPKIKP